MKLDQVIEWFRTHRNELQPKTTMKRLARDIKTGHQIGYIIEQKYGATND